MDGYLETLAHTARQLPGLVTLKDLQSRVIAINSTLAQLLGLRADTPVAGRYEFELAPCLRLAGAAFRAQDEVTLQQRRGRFIDILAYGDGRPRAILSEKVCLLDSTGAPRALLFQGVDITSRVFGHVNARLSAHVHAARSGDAAMSQSYALDPPAPEHALTPREEECLFFLLRGHTARSMAALLHLSVRTIEGYLDQLKDRFHCDSKADLIERAIAAGYASFLPATLLA